MWVTVLQENLSKALGTVGRAVPSRATLPVTLNVLLQTDSSRLKLTATNLEIAISTWVGAQVEHDGAITIPARLLTEFVNSLPNDKIQIELSDHPKGISLTCGRFQARMAGTDAEEFPPIPTVSDGVIARVPAGELKGAIARVAMAAATDDSRPVLTGIKVEIEGEDLTLAAADGFRLGVDMVKLAKPFEDKAGFIIPAKTFQEVQRIIGGPDEEVELTVAGNKSQVLFRLSNTEIVSQLIQGNFPDYAKLIPTSTGTEATVDLPDFQQAAKAASIFARDGSGIVRLHVVPGEDGGSGKMTVASKAEELGDNVSEIDAQVKGDAAKVAFDARFLLDVLNVLDKGEVTLGTTTPSSPGVIRSKAHPGYTHVVMPMFVQW
ncbi:MAG: DNA polymerase III subunit beta [Chloroflexi bacterium]|nr:DNA polymerase III subunit beta [Chloroflexota bacterium]